MLTLTNTCYRSVTLNATTLQHIKCDMVGTIEERALGHPDCNCPQDDDGNDDCDDGMPCFQASSYQGCFDKGALGASPWGDTNTISQGAANSKCWMNKADCWYGCDCGIDTYPDDKSEVYQPSNQMAGEVEGVWRSGVEKCFLAGAQSACIWGHCEWNGETYSSTAQVEGGTTYFDFTVDHTCEVAPIDFCDSGPGAQGDRKYTYNT